MGNSKGSLTPFFEPKSVAIVGASAVPGKAGHELIRNILANAFPGRLHPVNPKGGEILGLPVSSSIETLPDGVDLALVVLPAEATPAAVRECAAKGIRHVVCMAGGFAEVDEAGTRIQQELVEIVRETGIRLMGPNISGHTSTPAAFTSAFFPLGKIRRGTVSIIAQTGNFATHTMKYILTGEHYGVCRVIGLGNKVDLDETDALEYLADDPETTAILLYLESFKRPARFLEVARAVTRKKPVVILKSGATEAGRQAAVAHTAALAAEDRVVDGMLRQAGIVRVTEYTHLLLALKALSMLPLPSGNRVSFLAPSGALLVVLSDLCVRLGLEVPAVRPETVARLARDQPSVHPDAESGGHLGRGHGPGGGVRLSGGDGGRPPGPHRRCGRPDPDADERGRGAVVRLPPRPAGDVSAKADPGRLQRGQGLHGGMQGLPRTPRDADLLRDGVPLRRPLHPGSLCAGHGQTAVVPSRASRAVAPEGRVCLNNRTTVACSHGGPS